MNSFSPFSILETIAPLLVSAFCIITFYDFVAVSLLVRFLLSRKVMQKAELRLNKNSGLSGVLGLLWKSLKFEYFENLNHKTWLNPSLKWHIRLFRALFYLLVVSTVVFVVWFAVFYANTLGELYNFDY